MTLTKNKSELTEAQEQNHAKLGEIKDPKSRIAKIMEISAIDSKIAIIEEGYLVSLESAKTPALMRESLSESFGVRTNPYIEGSVALQKETAAIIKNLAETKKSVILI